MQENNKFDKKELEFIGPEFLTWAYFYLTNEGTEANLKELCPKSKNFSEGDQQVKFVIGKKILLQPLEAKEVRVQVQSPVLDGCGEVLQAISSGSLIASMSLDFVFYERVYSFTIHARDGAITEVKSRELFEMADEDEFAVEDVEKSENEKAQNAEIVQEEKVFLRMTTLDDIEDILSGLFRTYLTRRLAQAFVAEDVYDIRQLVSEGLKDKLPKMKKKIETPNLSPEQGLSA